MGKWTKTPKYILVLTTLFMCLPALAFAAQSSSANYQVNEVFFGSGGELNSCTAN